MPKKKSIEGPFFIQYSISGDLILEYKFGYLLSEWEGTQKSDQNQSFNIL